MYKNEQLVQLMKERGVLTSPKIEEAFLNIDRKDFVLKAHQDHAYYDGPLPIGDNQTISQPSTVAFMLEILNPEKNDEILDVGCGSGYTTALLSYIAEKNGKVWGVERIPNLLDLARKNLKKYHNLNYKLFLANEEYFGIKGKKFDRILISAAAKKMPEEILKQLKSPGKLVIPITDSVYLYEKDKNGEIKSSRFFGFNFVPLIKNNYEK